MNLWNFEENEFVEKRGNVSFWKGKTLENGKTEYGYTFPYEYERYGAYLEIDPKWATLSEHFTIMKKSADETIQHLKKNAKTL